MIRTVDIAPGPTLDDYAAHLHLAPLVDAVREAARDLAPRLAGRTVWMVNSTATGGGVAEMLPRVVTMMRELGVSTEWAVVGTDDARFFPLTKRLHNMIHGAGSPDLGPAEAEAYAEVSRANAEELASRVGPNDILVVHDPQPAGSGAIVRDRLGIPAIWRCHIGLEHQNRVTRAAWDFLSTWLERYDRAVFSVPSYVPDYLEERSAIIAPAIDPLSHKNRELPIHKLTGILHAAGLHHSPHPQIAGSFTRKARRLQADGRFGPAVEPEEPGLMYRPVITQVSRWDELKGFAPLLEGFARLKRVAHASPQTFTGRHRKRLQICRLVLAGPDPSGVSDDPEAVEVLDALCARILELPEEVRRDVVLLVLPMESRKENALMVNAIQRCSTIICQNSLQEGFGLTATEAMWKGTPVLGSSAAGLRAQIRSGVDGGILQDAEDVDALALTLNLMLAAPKTRETMGDNGRRRAGEEFLVFSQVRRWLEVLAATADGQDGQPD